MYPLGGFVKILNHEPKSNNCEFNQEATKRQFLTHHCITCDSVCVHIHKQPDETFEKTANYFRDQRSIVQKSEGACLLGQEGFLTIRQKTLIRQTALDSARQSQRLLH